jgi:hypothetical protein
LIEDQMREVGAFEAIRRKRIDAAFRDRALAELSAPRVSDDAVGLYWRSAGGCRLPRSISSCALPSPRLV